MKYFFNIFFLFIFFYPNKCNGDENPITLEQCKKLSKNCKIINLNYLTEIDDLCLDALCKGSGSLSLNGLKNLSHNKAKILSQTRRLVYLDGLNYLDIKCLTELSKCESGVSLGNLKEPDLAQLHEINKFKHIYLGGIKKISLAAARLLLNSKCFSISFNGLTEIDINALKVIALSKTKFFMAGIKEIDLEMAKIISRGEASFVFSGVKKITDDVFSVLNTSKSNIYLDGLERLTSFQSFEYRNGSGNLICSNVTELNVDFIESNIYLEKPLVFPFVKKINGFIAKKMGGFNRRIISLPSLSEITPDQAYWLGLASGDLDLRGLSEIDEISINYLSDFTGNLNLGGLKCLSFEKAQCLSRHVGYLDLSGVLEVDDITSKKLGNHIGSINLTGVKKISDGAFCNLGSVKNVTFENIIYIPNPFRLIKSIIYFTSINFNGETFDLSFATKGSIIHFGALENPNFLKILTCVFDTNNKISLSIKHIEHLPFFLLCLSKKTIDFAEICNIDLFFFLPLFLHYGNITLDGIEINNEFMFFLISMNKGQIVFGELDQITDFEALCLANHKGFISLDKLKKITTNQIGVLIKHDGVIGLPKHIYDSILDPKTKDILEKYPFSIR